MPTSTSKPHAPCYRQHLANLACQVAQSTGPVPSPCVNVCCMEARTDFCAGCFRTLDELSLWSRASEAEKRLIWQRVAERVAQPAPALEWAE